MKDEPKPDRASALYTSEQRYRKLVETMGDGLSEIDEHQVTTYANDTLCRMWQRTRQEIIGQKVTRFLDEKNRAVLMEQLEHRRKGRREPYEITWIRKDGTPITTRMTPTPYFDVNGRFKGSFAVVTDISELKKEKQRLEQTQDELEKRVSMRTFELEEKTRKLEEVNTALRVLLKKRQEDRTELEHQLVSNIRELVFPYIEKIKHTDLDSRQQAFMDIISATLSDIVSPFLNRLSLEYRGLTPSEIQVAHLVKHGSSTKEIAGMMGLSSQTIAFYRKNIRKKIGLTNQALNLRTFLNSLS